jgi:hypothetical protein
MLVDASSGANNFSARFDGGAATKQMLERTPGAHTSRRIFTLSFWVKFNNGFGLFDPTPIYAGYDLTGSNITEFAHVDHNYNVSFPNGPGGLDYFDEGGTNMQNVGGSGTGTPGTDWDHFLLAVDTTQALLANRIRTYVNNVEMPGTNTCPQNTDAILTLNELHMIGAQFNGAVVDYVDDVVYARTHIAELIFVDGQQLTPTSFMVPAGANPAKAKAYTGTYGAQGFYLNFADSNDMGKDVSGNGNHWAPHSGLNPPTQSNLNPFNF